MVSQVFDQVVGGENRERKNGKQFAHPVQVDHQAQQGEKRQTESKFSRHGYLFSGRHGERHSTNAPGHGRRRSKLAFRWPVRFPSWQLEPRAPRWACHGERDPALSAPQRARSRRSASHFPLGKRSKASLPFSCSPLPTYLRRPSVWREYSGALTGEKRFLRRRRRFRTPVPGHLVVGLKSLRGRRG